MEGKTTESRQGTPQRLWLANEANLKFAVKDIKVTGQKNIKEIPAGAKVVVLTTHLTDLDVPLAIHAVGHELNVAIMNLSTHHKFFGKQGEAPTNIGIRIAGKGNFIPIDYHKDESGIKSPKAFNPDNFEPAVRAMQEGKSVVTAAHSPSSEFRESLEGVRGGYGGVYLAELTDAYVLPVVIKLDRATGMYKTMVKTITIAKPNAAVTVGKPFKLEKIAGIERFAEINKKREDGIKLSDEERVEFSRLADALRERSQVVMKQLSDQLKTPS